MTKTRSRPRPTAPAARIGACLLLAGTVAGAVPQTEDLASHLDAVQVTATRFAAPIQEVPRSISIVTGEELRERGVSDLRGALAGFAGITVGPGGDDGTAGASLGLLGRRESDDFLLVVDGVPAGGVFAPQFATLNLHGVDRIEVVRGTTPVYFGTVAFAGTVSVFHRGAGARAPGPDLSIGSRGSIDISAGYADATGGLRQSLMIDATRERLADSRAGFNRAHGLYRAAGNLGGGQARLDLELTELHDRPASPTPYDGASALLGPDFNQNPANGHVDTRLARISAAYDRALGAATWSSLLSLTRTRTDSARGFLDPGYAAETGTNAAGFEQLRRVEDWFIDSHVSRTLGEQLELSAGLNLLQGRLRTDSRQFDYLVPLEGSLPAASGDSASADRTHLGDRRRFFGAYLQTRWKAAENLSLLGGLRWNRASEARDSLGDIEGADHRSARSQRLTGSIGVNARLWRDPSGDLDDLSVYAHFGNAFQPPQVDLGPDAQTNPILAPESLRSVEIGAKADALEGRFDVDLAAFFVRFFNRPLNTSVDNQPTQVAGGEERFRGWQLELHYRLTPQLKLAADFAGNNAAYGDFSTQLDGASTPVQLAGRHIEFVPQRVLGLGLIWNSAQGWHGSLNVKTQGRRWLDPLNQASASGFTTLDTSAGYRWKDWSLTLVGENLGDRRDPVLASELGSGQVYRLGGRRLALFLSTKSL